MNSVSPRVEALEVLSGRALGGITGDLGGEIDGVDTESWGPKGIEGERNNGEMIEVKHRERH